MYGLALLLAVELFAPMANAQSVEAYTYARSGRPTMTLYVWGAVGRPGIWHVEQEANLVEILSIVNVQPGRSASGSTNEKRFLRVYRSRDGASAAPESTASRVLVFEAPLEDVMLAVQAAPQPRDGDILSIEVETQERIFTLRNISSFIGTAASLTLLIIRLTSL